MSKTKNFFVTILTLVLVTCCVISASFISVRAEFVGISNSDFIGVSGIESGSVNASDINATDVVLPYKKGSAVYYGDAQNPYRVDMSSFSWSITINALAVGQSFTVSFIKDTSKMPFDGAVGVSYVFHRVESAINCYIIDAADGALLQEMIDTSSMWAYYKDGEFEEYPVTDTEGYCGGMVGKIYDENFTGKKLNVINMVDNASFSGTTYRPSMDSTSLGRTVPGTIFENREIDIDNLVLVISAGAHTTFDGVPTDDISFTLSTPNDKKTKAYKSEATRLQLVTKLSSYVTASEKAVQGELSADEYTTMLADVANPDLSMLRTRERYVQEANLGKIRANIALVNQKTAEIPNVVNAYGTALQALSNLDEITAQSVAIAKAAKDEYDVQSAYIGYVQGVEAEQIQTILATLNEKLLTRAEIHLQIEEYEEKTAVLTTDSSAKNIVEAQHAKEAIQTDLLSSLEAADKVAFENRISACDNAVKAATLGKAYDVENYKITLYRNAVNTLNNDSSVTDFATVYGKRPVLALTGIIESDRKTLKEALAEVDKALGAKILSVIKGWADSYGEAVYELNLLTGLSQDKIDAAVNACYNKEEYSILCGIAQEISYDISAQTNVIEEYDRIVAAAPARLLLVKFNSFATGEMADVSDLNAAYTAWLAAKHSDVSNLSQTEKTAYDNLLASSVTAYEMQAKALINGALEEFETAANVANIKEFAALNTAKEARKAVPNLEYLIVEDDYNIFSDRYATADAKIKAQTLYYINDAGQSWSVSESDKGICLDNTLAANDNCNGLAVIEEVFDINDFDFAFEFTKIGRIWKGEDPAGSGKYPQSIYVMNVLAQQGKNKNEAQGFSIYFYCNVLNELEIIVYGAATQAGEVQLASGKITDCGFMNEPYEPYTVRVRITKDTNCYRLWVNSLQLTIYFRDIINPDNTKVTHLPEYAEGDEIGADIFVNDKAYVSFVVFANGLNEVERNSAITIRMIGDKTFGGYVAPVYMVSLELVSGPTKTTYQKGETFDKTGIVMKATMSDGSVADIPLNKIKVLGFTSTSKGQKNVSLSYTDESGVTLTKVVKVTIVDAEKENGGKKGCNGSFAGVSAFAALISVTGAIVMLKKKKIG